jgi:hypothetical protein
MKFKHSVMMSKSNYVSHSNFESQSQKKKNLNFSGRQRGLSGSLGIAFLDHFSSFFEKI